MSILENPRHELFAHEFLVDHNQTKAAIRAGYSEKSARSTGPAIMKNPAVLARIRELQHEQCERLCLNADWVLLALAKVADKAMQAEPVMKSGFDTKQMTETGEYTFDSKGANRALELIGKHIGMFADNVNVSMELPGIIYDITPGEFSA